MSPLRLLVGILLLVAAVGFQGHQGYLVDHGRGPGISTMSLYGSFQPDTLVPNLKLLWLTATQLVLALPGCLLLGLTLARWRPSALLLARCRRRLRRALAVPRVDRDLALLAALVVGGLALALGADPLVDDEATFVLQARMLLQGGFALPAPEHAELFRNQFTFHATPDGRYLGMYLPTWPLVLAPFTALGDPRWVCPLLAGALLLAVSRLAGSLFPDRPPAARLAPLLLLGSPWFLLTASSLASQTLSALVLAAGLWLLLAPGIRAGLAAGALWGLAFTLRPASAAAALPAALYAIVSGERPGRRLLELMPGALAGLAVHFGYSWWVTGDPWTPPLAWFNPVQVMGFPRGEDGIPIHTPIRGIGILVLNLLRVEHWTTGWPTTFAMLVPLLFRPAARSERILGLWLLGHAALYFGYGFEGVAVTGPAYWFETLVPLVLLLARGLSDLPDRLSRENLRALHAALGLATLLSLCHVLPLRASQVADLRDLSGAPYQLLSRLPGRNVLVVTGFSNLETPGWRFGYQVVHPDLVPAGEPLLVRPGPPASILAWASRRGAGAVLVLERGEGFGWRLRPWSPEEDWTRNPGAGRPYWPGPLRP